MTSELSLTAIGTWSEAKYTNNPDAVLTYESENESNLDRVYAKGMRANGTPLSAYSLALDYNVKGWFFNLTETIMIVYILISQAIVVLAAYWIKVVPA